MKRERRVSDPSVKLPTLSPPTAQPDLQMKVLEGITILLLFIFCIVSIYAIRCSM